MLLYLIFNSLIVFGLNKLVNIDIELTCRISSLIHSVVSLFGSLFFLGNIIDYNQFQEIIKYNVVYISTDVYLYLNKNINTSDKMEMMVHHICFLIGSYMSYINPGFYAYGIMSEGSTIFLNTRWFAINGYYFKNIDLHTILLWISFLIFRIINMTNLVYLMITGIYYKYSILLLPFICLNYVWFYYLTLKSIKSLISIKNKVN
jgi:hypothetical protein